jgi:hypothetical protein
LLGKRKRQIDKHRCFKKITALLQIDTIKFVGGDITCIKKVKGRASISTFTCNGVTQPHSNTVREVRVEIKIIHHLCLATLSFPTLCQRTLSVEFGVLTPPGDSDPLSPLLHGSFQRRCFWPFRIVLHQQSYSSPLQCQQWPHGEQ